MGDDVWQDGAQFRPAHQRPIGVVFQEASLFAHLSVRRNLLYGQRRAMAQGANQEIRFDDVIELLGITRLLERSTRDLSGGERQRVAIGRALLSQPKLLLMDEPLSALDRLTKEDILPYLEKLHASLAIPVLYVTHDLSEVERLADHIVLIERGRVIAAGLLSEVQGNPALPLARVPGAAVSLSARIEAHDTSYGLTKLGVSGATLFVPQVAAAIGEMPAHPRLRIGCKPRAQCADGQLDPQHPAGASARARPRGPQSGECVDRAWSRWGRRQAPLAHNPEIVGYSAASGRQSDLRTNQKRCIGLGRAAPFSADGGCVIFVISNSL